MRKNWTGEEDDRLRALWAATDLWRLREVFDRSEASLFHRAYALGLKKTRRSGFYRPESALRYRVNEDAFRVLTPDTAYVLGFIVADGRVESDKWLLHIWQGDREHLIRVREAIGSTHPIATERRGTHVVYRLTIARKRLVESLRDLGLTSRKSWEATVPPVPDDLFGHFLRGLFDGDGTVKAAGYGVDMTFHVGAEQLLTQLSSRLAVLYGVPLRPVRRYRADRQGHYAFRLGYYGRTALALASVMYADAPALCLERKRLIFERWRHKYLTSPLRHPRATG